MTPQGLVFLLAAPALLLGAVIGLLLATVLPAVVQALLAKRLGDSMPAKLQRRSSLDIRRHIDPFSVVAMVLGGVGWAKRVDLDQRRLGSRGRLMAVLVAGLAVNLVLATAALAALRLLPSGDLLLRVLGRVDLGDLDDAPQLGTAALVVLMIGLTNLFVAALRVIPLPPLDGAQALWAFAPRTSGWARARYLLEEQNYGLVAVLALLLPLFSGAGLLVRVVGAMADPVLRALAQLLV